jgi:HSP20 family molecular chaperone IbpA
MVVPHTKRAVDRSELRMRAWERDGEHVVEIETPGLGAEDVNVKLHGHVVSIHADGLVRSLRLPDGVEANGLRAAFANGVLRLRAPSVPVRTRTVPIADQSANVHPDAAAT